MSKPLNAEQKERLAQWATEETYEDVLTLHEAILDRMRVSLLQWSDGEGAEALAYLKKEYDGASKLTRWFKEEVQKLKRQDR